MSLDALPWKESLTLAIALLGAVLGIMNTWNAMNDRRVRLRVKPAHAFTVPQGDHMFSIEVVNLSTFALTISDVGFSIDDQGVDSGRRIAITAPIIIDGKPWPRRLEARESVSIYFDPGDIIRHGARIDAAYARTACGETKYGTSPAVKQLRAAIDNR
jgi:hypothetical protein